LVLLTWFQGENTIGAQKCGNSQFEAAREVSKRYKGLEVTGNVMTSCGHGVIQCSIDMHEGETFRHTFASHIKVHSLKNQKQHKNLNIPESEKITEEQPDIANTIFILDPNFLLTTLCVNTGHSRWRWESYQTPTHILLLIWSLSSLGYTAKRIAGLARYWNVLLKDKLILTILIVVTDPKFWSLERWISWNCRRRTGTSLFYFFKLQ